MVDLLQSLNKPTDFLIIGILFLFYIVLDKKDRDDRKR